MFCGRCGVSDDMNVIKTNIEQDGDVITITSYGKCSECGEYLGLKEIFRYEDYEYLDREEVKKVLEGIKAMQMLFD